MSENGIWGDEDPIEWSEHELGITGTYSRADLNRRYLSVMKEYHPDVYAKFHPDLSPEEAETKAKRINVAYGVLKDEFVRTGTETMTARVRSGRAEVPHAGTTEDAAPGEGETDAGAMDDVSYDPWAGYGFDGDDAAHVSRFMARPMWLNVLRSVACHMPWNLLLFVFAVWRCRTVAGVWPDALINGAAQGISAATEANLSLWFFVSVLNLLFVIAMSVFHVKDIFAGFAPIEAIASGLGGLVKLVTILILDRVDAAYGIEDGAGW